MYVTYSVLFYRHTNHVCVSHSAKTNHGDECDCDRLYVRLIYWASFSFSEEWIGLTHDMILHMHVHG
jgi:hypothetical protein